MTSKSLLPALLVALLAAAALSVHAAPDAPAAATPKSDASQPALERFKQLAGDWVGKEVEGHPGDGVHVHYQVTAGGTAVVETLFPGTDHEMVTIIHADGADLALTHFCMLGNQPQMKATAPADGKEVAFKFIRATNLKSDKDMHMHEVAYTFVDADTLKHEWTNYNDGKPAGTVVFELKRKK